MVARPERPVVLVVEDEVITRVGLAALVQEAGFQPIEASNAARAVTILEARDDVRIVFTDINMPGPIDGLQLASAVSDRWPSIGIILASGQRFPGLDEMPARSLFLTKPLTARDVAEALTALVKVG